MNLEIMTWKGCIRPPSFSSLQQSVGLLSVKTWMEGTFDIPYKNPQFFVITEPNHILG